MPITVLIADDHPVVREGLRTLLAEEADIRIVGEAADGEEAVRIATREEPHVVLMDLVMPLVDGVTATRMLRDAGVRSRVLVLTSFADDARVRDVIQAGAAGYVLKDVQQPELMRAIRAVAAGQPALHSDVQRRLLQHVTGTETPSVEETLTGRERTVLGLIAQGRSNKQIAAALQLSETTVRWYVSAILQKLGVDRRTEAALYAVRHGLADKAH
jgi:DNA-binding NarL/FixJ family response regulator